MYVLYQFLLKRPLLNAGGKLLPALVDFYQWLHNEIAYTITLEDACKINVETVLSTFLNRHLPEQRDNRLNQFKAITRKHMYIYIIAYI